MLEDDFSRVLEKVQREEELAVLCLKVAQRLVKPPKPTLSYIRLVTDDAR